MVKCLPHSLECLVFLCTQLLHHNLYYRSQEHVVDCAACADTVFYALHELALDYASFFKDLCVMITPYILCLCAPVKLWFPSLSVQIHAVGTDWYVPQSLDATTASWSAISTNFEVENNIAVVALAAKNLIVTSMYSFVSFQKSWPIRFHTPCYGYVGTILFLYHHSMLCMLACLYHVPRD